MPVWSHRDHRIKVTLSSSVIYVRTVPGTLPGVNRGVPVIVELLQPPFAPPDLNASKKDAVSCRLLHAGETLETLRSVSTLFRAAFVRRARSAFRFVPLPLVMQPPAK